MWFPITEVVDCAKGLGLFAAEQVHPSNVAMYKLTSSDGLHPSSDALHALVAMASTLLGMASTLSSDGLHPVAMASNLLGMETLSQVEH